jgi:hypothetical protein
MMTKINKTIVSALVVFALVLSAAPVFADEGRGTSGYDSPASTTPKTESSHPAVKTAAANLEAKKQTETERHEQFCANKRRVVGSILNKITSRGQKQLDVFTRIAARTEKFKIDKNLTVDNYDALVTTVNDKKTSAQNTLDKIKADAAAAASLSCDPGQPKSIVGGFKNDLKAESAALKDYKTAIKNLIVAVKTSKSSTEAQ